VPMRKPDTKTIVAGLYIVRSFTLMRGIAAGGIALGIVVCAGCDPHDDPARAAPPVQSPRVTQPAARDVVAVGILKSQVGAEVKVGSQVSGVVAKLHVGVGDPVERGDALADLDDAQWRARVTSLEAELAAAVAELDYARADISRMQRVPSFSPAQVENGQRNVQVRQAMVEQARARLAEAQVQLGYTRIRAPISGTVASVSTYEGETVAAAFAAPTFVTIVDPGRLELHAYVDEHDIATVRAGQPVKFRVDAFRGRELQGTVRAVYPKPQIVNNVVNYIVVVDFRIPADLVVRPEMTAHVTFAAPEAGEEPRTVLGLREAK
jgi:HlyD family secretion protein